MSDWPTIKAAMVDALADVTGLNYVLGYEPTSIQAGPMMWLQLDSVAREYDAQGSQYTYRVMGTLAVPWQDPAESEKTFDDLINAIMEAFDADMTVDGTVNGAALGAVADAGFAEVAGTKYRMAEFGFIVTHLEC